MRALRDAVARSLPDKEVLSVGRDGASDAVVVHRRAGIPAVEFGPVRRGGHHGPGGMGVGVLAGALPPRARSDFVRALPMWLERQCPTGRGER